jgi:integrase
LSDFRPISVERWLESLPYAPATRAKIRNLLSALFQHSIRQGWAENNPIHAVRTSSKRLREPDILTPEEINLLLLELPEPCRTIALVAALTGMRISEILGLQWQDVDLEVAVLRIERGVVNQEVSATKTAGSRRPLPISKVLVDALRVWWKQTCFSGLSDWVFASPHCGGAQPYWPGTLLQRHVKPAAKRLGIAKQVGWHSFRRSYATLIYANEQDVKTAQELLRHSTPQVTLGVYAQAITEQKRQAQERLATSIFPDREADSANAA